MPAVRSTRQRVIPGDRSRPEAFGREPLAETRMRLLRRQPPQAKGQHEALLVQVPSRQSDP
jgi:hypothetical protein